MLSPRTGRQVVSSSVSGRGKCWWLPRLSPPRPAGRVAFAQSVGRVSRLIPELEAGAAVEDRVVSYERDVPADRGRCDPQVSVVASLVQSVPDLPAFASQLCDGLDRLDVNRQDACACDQTGEVLRPSRAPAGAERAITGLGDCLRGERDALPEQVLRIACGERRALPETRGEDVRIDEDGRDTRRAPLRTKPSPRRSNGDVEVVVRVEWHDVGHQFLQRWRIPELGVCPLDMVVARGWLWHHVIHRPSVVGGPGQTKRCLVSPAVGPGYRSGICRVVL